VEHYAGAFPLWLAPEQVRVLPLTENQIEYADEICDRLREGDIRAGVDRKSEKIGAKIRRAQLEKIPIMLILGPKEAEEKVVSVRRRLEGDQGSMRFEELMQQLQKQNVPETQTEETT